MRVIVTTPPDEALGDYVFDGAVGWAYQDNHSLDVEVAPGRHIVFDGGTWAWVRFDEEGLAVSTTSSPRG